jgi:DNA topoisomerase IA
MVTNFSWLFLQNCPNIVQGPCQFPTLGLVVDRLLTIRAFQPRLFYYLELKVRCKRSGAEELVLSWDRKHLFDR